MNGRLLALGVLCLIAAAPCRMAHAAVVTHTNVEDFLPGLSDGLAVPVFENAIAATGPRNGAVAVVPQPGASIISDDFTYADQTAAEAAGWGFFIGEPMPVPPSAFVFNPSPGSMRMSVGRTQDFHNPAVGGQKSPILAYRNEPVDGDFMVETKLTFAEPRQRERSVGIIIASYGDDFAPLIIDDSMRYIAAAVEGPDVLISGMRAYPGTWPQLSVTGSHTATSYIIRVVKRGQYVYTYFRASESQPWVFHYWFKVPKELSGDPLRPLLVGLYAKSWGGKNAADDIQNIDFDYFRVNRIAPNFTGVYTNVMDAGINAHWSTFSLATHSMQGLRLQMRTGNTLSAGTLTDAGPFVGPDGTADTYFEDNTAMKVPNPDGKRYLEYKLLLDQTPANLPATAISLSGYYQPAPFKASIVSDEAEWGSGGSGLSVQTGGGDLSLTRTLVVHDEFSGSSLGPEWSFRPGNPSAVPPGDYTLTERPGFVRLKVGFPQDLYGGDNDLGGVAVLRTIPAGLTDYEVETEVQMETQQNRASALLLWSGTDDFAGIALARRNFLHWDIGTLGDAILGNGFGPAPTSFYGTNRMQLRISKVGQFLTMSYRDAAGPSPSWRTLFTWNASKSATGGVDWVPTHVALLAKSYDGAQVDRDLVDVDYDYLKISSLAVTGTKDIPVALPAEYTPDALLIYGENAPASAAKFQIQEPGGAWVGPDGTTGSFFTVDEPKIPASLANQATANIRATLNGQQVTGMPYIHALGVQYAVPGAAIVRDTNAADFTGAKLGIDTSVPGLITGMMELGAANVEEFNTTPSGWLFSDVNPGGPLPTSAFTGSAAQLTIPRVVDSWGSGDALTKPRAFLYRDQILTGDYEVEARVTFVEPRQGNRHGGIALVAARPEGTGKDDKIDVTNVLMFGPYQLNGMRFLRFVNNTVGDLGPIGWTGESFYIRMRKVGDNFTGFAKVNASDPWIQVEQTTHPNLANAYVGFLAKSWPLGGETAPQTYSFDYLTVTPIVATSGTYESRVFDLGATGLFPTVGTLGGNAANVRIQWRAADSAATLEAEPWIGPDGTNATTYSGTYQGFLPASVSGKRYYQYRATLPVSSSLNDLALMGLTVGPPSPLDNAIAALRIAGGLKSLEAADLTRLDVVKGDSADKVELTDAVSLARTALGL